MSDQNRSTVVVWLVAIAVLTGASAAYTGAYIGLTTKTTRNLHTGGTCRLYRSMWQAMMFLPASLVETAVTGRDVSPAWPGP